jgi:Family of unknown function (DUF6502)
MEMCLKHIDNVGMSNQPSDQHPALDAIAALFVPLARLALAQGLTAPMLEEALRMALVQACKEGLVAQGLPEHRLVSRISAGAGLTRREVMRLNEQLAQGRAAHGHSLAAEVFTRWVADPALRPARGKPRTLPRHGEAPSFEALAKSVTQDVHPRTLLDELCRLGMAELDDTGDKVTLLKTAFVPDGDQQQMLGFLAANVGDHLSGAVSNVMGEAGRRHFDQAVFADDLALASLPHIHEFVRARWKTMLSEAVELLEGRIEADRDAGLVLDQRVRIGLYSYDETVAHKPVAAQKPKPAMTKPAKTKAQPEAQAKAQAKPRKKP